MAGRNPGIIETWELWRKILLGLVVVLILFVAVTLSMPIGILFIVFLVMVSKIWRPIGQTTNSMKGEYRTNTLPFKLASFFMAYKSRYRQSLFTPVISLGMGPPREDKDHDVVAGWGPPTRLSSYWSLIGAIGLGFIDYFTAALRFPFWSTWSDFRVPAVIMYVVGVVGFYVGIQSLLDVRRIRADKTGIVGTEAAPAVIVSRIRGHIDLKAQLKKAAIIGSMPPVIVLIIWALTGMPWYIALSIVFGLLIITLLIALSVAITTEWRASWIERNEKRLAWDDRFSFLKDRSPIYVGEQEYPTLEEYFESVKDLGPEVDPPPYEPSLSVATFLFPPNCTYADYLGIVHKIKGSLDAQMASISPIGKIDPDTGAETVGTIGSTGIRVWWSKNDITIADIINPETNRWVREFGIRSLILPAIESVRGLGHCVLQSNHLMTRKESSVNLLEVKIVPPPNVNLGSFLRALPGIREAIGTEWVGINQEDKSFQSTMITIMLGDNPSSPGIKFINPPRLSRSLIDISNWSYYFYVNNITGQSGETPRLIRRKPTTEIVDQLSFELPKGIQYATVQSKTQSLAETSGNDFMEASMGDGSKKQAILSKSDIEHQASQLNRFTMIAAARNPLERAFAWEDYKDRLLLPREKGKAKLAWSPGVLANDELVYDKWDGDLPHLLFGGASGMGKSQLAMSMLTQLVHNNGPDELLLHLIEPKNELQTFENVDICAEMVDSWTPDSEFMFNAAESAEAMVEEMNRRYRLMRDHKSKPKKLEKAREIAHREGPQADGSKHPLDLPYIIFFMEECATLFADAGSKEESQNQSRLVALVAELARKARASGIYLVFATQYPTNASIPSVIRNQCRRIGLGCQNSVASQVVIGQSDLASIRTPGLGMIRPDFDYRKFRGYWIKDGDVDNGEKNDIEDVLAVIPTNNLGNNVFSTALGGNGSTLMAGSYQRVAFPDPDDMAFNVWSKSSAGSSVANSVEDGLKTKDITDNDI